MKQKTIDLLTRYQTVTDTRERQKIETSIIKLNTGLVVKVCEKTQMNYRCNDWDDMFQLGSIGLLKAIRRFDPSKGTAFSSLAVPMIRFEIYRTLQRSTAIKYPRDWLETFPIIRRLREQGKTYDEIAELLTEKRGKPYNKSLVYDIYSALKQSDPDSLDRLNDGYEWVGYGEDDYPDNDFCWDDYWEDGLDSISSYFYCSAKSISSDEP